MILGKVMILNVLLISSAINCCFADIWNEEAKKFEEGKSYEYNYDAQMLTGAPETSWHYTGVRLRSTIQVHIRSFQNVILKMTDIRFLQFNDEIKHKDARIFLPVESFKELSQEDVQTAIQRELTKPIDFEWRFGQVANLRVESDDEFWSINIKKGLLNTLNVNIKPHRHMSPLNERNNLGDSYEGRYEDSIEGLCKSHYHWNVIPVDSTGSSREDNVAVQWTKTHGTKDCLENSMYQQSLITANDCDMRRMNSTRDAVDSESTTEMNISFWRGFHFFTWQARTISRYTYALSNAKGASISTLVNQELTFYKEIETDASTNLNLRNPRKESSLQLTIIIPKILNEKNVDTDFENTVWNLYRNIRERLQRNDASLGKEYIKLAPLVQDFVELLRKSPYAFIKNILADCQKNIEAFPEMMDLVNDALPSVATKEAIQVLIEEAPLQETFNVEADLKLARRIRQIASISNIYHTDIIYLLMKAASSQKYTQSKTTRESVKSLWMTLGALTRTYMQQNVWSQDQDPNVDIENEIAKSVYKFFQNLIRSKFRFIGEEEKMIIVLKALGNSGIREGLSIMHEVLYNTEKYTTAVKVQAIYAQKFLTKRFSLDIKRLLLPIFYNTEAKTELRLAAFTIIMRTSLNQQELDSILFVVQKEPVQQIKSFVISHWQAIVESRDSCVSDIRQNITRLIKKIDLNKQFGAQYSREFFFPIKERQNLFVKSGVFWTPEDFLPRSANVKIFSEAFGKKIDYIEFGGRFEGLQKLLRKLFGPQGRFFNVEKLEDLMKIYEDNEDLLTDNNFSFYLNVFGDQLGYWSMDENMKEVLQSGYLAVKKDWFDIFRGVKPLSMTMRRTLFHDGTTRIPTAFGVPFTANFSSFIHWNLKTSVKLSDSLFNMERTLMEGTFSPAVITEHRVVGGIDFSFIKSFTKIRLHASMPITRDIKYKLAYEKAGLHKSVSGVRVMVQRPPRDMHLFHIENQMSNTVQTKRGNADWQINEVPLIMKYETPDSQNQRNRVRHTSFRWPSTGLQVRVANILSVEKLLRDRIDGLFRGPFLCKVQLVNEEKQLDDYLEGRLLAIQGDTSNLRNSWMLQFLRSSEESIKVPLSLQTQNSNSLKTTTEEAMNMEVLSKKLIEATRSDFMFDLVVQVATRNESQSKSNEAVKQYDWLNLIRLMTNKKVMKKFVLHGIVSVGKAFRFQKTQPLVVDSDIADKMLIKVFDFSENQLNKELLSLQLSLDVNENCLSLKQLISKQIENFSPMFSFIRECSQNLKAGYRNTVACYQTWRYLNIFNRVNVTITVKPIAPKPIKTFVGAFMNFNNRIFGRILSSLHLNNWLRTKEQKQTNQLVFHRSIEVSPFDMQAIKVQMSLNELTAKYRRSILPNVWVNHLQSDVNFFTGLLNALTANRYPAMCSARISKQQENLQIKTFDNLLYNLNLKDVKTKGKLQRLIMSQDQGNNFQFSIGTTDVQSNTAFVQILTANEKMRSVLLERKLNENTVRLFLNGQRVSSNFTEIYNTNGKPFGRISIEQADNEADVVVIIDVQSLGISLRTNVLDVIDFYVSPFYHSTTRGLCGDFNGEQRQEHKTKDCQRFFVKPTDIIKRCDYFSFTNRPLALEEMLQSKVFSPFVNISSCPTESKSILKNVVRPLTISKKFEDIDCSM